MDDQDNDFKEMPSSPEIKIGNTKRRLIIISIVIGVIALFTLIGFLVLRSSPSDTDDFNGFYKLLKNDSEIKRKDIDTKKYQIVELKDKRKGIFISDPNTTMAGFSYSFGTGSTNDFKYGFDGTAHLLEHSLFLGSHTYEGNILDSFLMGNAGNFNAYTMQEETVYGGTIPNSNFAKLTSIYLNNILDPKLEANTIFNERNAVNSEFEQTRFLEYEHSFTLLKAQFAKTNGFHYPSCGNLKSFGADPEALAKGIRDYYKDNYKAENSNFVIFSSDSFYDQKKQVKEVLEKIKTVQEAREERQLEAKTQDVDLPKFIIYNSATQVDVLEIFLFPKMPSKEDIKYKPNKYINFTLENNGKDSFFGWLKENDYVHSAELAAGFDRTKDFEVGVFYLELTDKGAKNTDEIQKRAYFWVEKAKKSLCEAENFKNFKKVTNFEAYKDLNSDPFSFVMETASVILREDISHTINNWELEMDLNCDLYSKYGEYYSKDNSMIVFASSDISKHAEMTGKMGQEQKHYLFDTKYFVSKPDQVGFTTQTEDDTVTQKWKIREPNQFIPEKVNMVEPCSSCKEDEYDVSKPSDKLVNYTEGDAVNPRILYKIDNSFKLPKVSVDFTITFKDTVKADDMLFLSMIARELNNRLSQTDLSKFKSAGLEFDLQDADQRSILIKVYGLTNLVKLALGLIKTELNNILSLTDNAAIEKVFNKNKPAIQEQIVASEKKMPYNLKEMHLDSILYSDFVTPAQLKAKIISKEFNSALFAAKLKELKNSQTLSRAYGSFETTFLKENILPLDKLFDNKIEANSRPISGAGGYFVSTFVVPTTSKKFSTSVIFGFNKTENELEHSVLAEAVQIYFQEPIFTELRTKQQLGYIAKSIFFEKGETAYWEAVVQGEKLSADKVQTKIFEVIKAYSAKITDDKMKNLLVNLKERLANPQVSVDQRAKNTLKYQEFGYSDSIQKKTAVIDRFLSNIAEARTKFISAFELAEGTGCTVIRIFPSNVPLPQEGSEIYPLDNKTQGSTSRGNLFAPK